MRKKHRLPLSEKYPSSEPCSCEICRAYCLRPGWWTVEEATKAMEAGYADRMMLEVAPGFTFGVLSPAFKGCEQNFALQEYASSGCTFLTNGLCAIHGTGLMPLECRVCHHDRQGLGAKCHADLEKDWNTSTGKLLVTQWINITGIKKRYGI